MGRFSESAQAWRETKPAPPQRVVRVRWAVALVVATGAVSAGAASWALQPEGNTAPTPTPTMLVTVTVSGEPQVVTMSPTPETSSTPPKPSQTPTHSTKPSVQPTAPRTTPKPTKTKTVTAKPKPTKTKTVSPKPTKTSSAPKASRTPSISSLSCNRTGMNLKASASFSTGGSGGTLRWVLDGEEMSRSFGAGTSSASAHMELLAEEASSCQLTITTSGGSDTASRRSD